MGMVREREESGLWSEGRLKSIIPQGDIGKGKISCKSSFHLVSFGII